MARPLPMRNGSAMKDTAIQHSGRRCLGAVTIVGRLSLVVFALGMLLLVHAWRVARQIGSDAIRQSGRKILQTHTAHNS